MTTATKSRPRIESVKVEHLLDESPDLSTLGDFINDLDDDCILWATGEFIIDLRQNEEWEAPARGREYRCFRPYAGGEKPDSAEWRTYATQDYERMRGLENGHWNYMGIRATAEVVINGTVQTIASDGLWGIESDSDKDYLRNTALIELEQLGDVLLGMGCDVQNVAYAMRDASFPV